MIDGRDQTKLIDGLDRHVAAVREALASTGKPPPIHGVLCFTRADLPFLGRTRMRSHLLLYPRALAKRLSARGPLSPAAIDQTAHALAATFPSA